MAHTIRACCTVALLLLLSALALGQETYFLQLDGIDGESTAIGFEDQICVGSFSWDVTRQTNIGGGGGGPSAGAAAQEDFKFGKLIDASSADLYETLTTGKIIRDGILTIRSLGETGELFTRAEYEFETIMLTGVQPGGSGDGPPKEVLSLRANQVTLTIYDDRGRIISSHAWDFASNTDG